MHVTETPDTGILSDASTLSIRAGARMGRFELIEELGRGGMGVVFRARDSKLERDVALKLLSNPLSSASDTRARMLREAKALAQLSHANVVPVFEAGEQDGQVYIAMELVEGQALDEWLRHSTRSLRKRLDVLSQAASGLAAAHQKGIVHRDFKPSNLIVGSDGRVRVLDFGIASVRDTALSDGTLTATNQLVGTPMYMAPEQIQHGTASVASDAFSFGVVAYETLADSRPFEASSVNALAVQIVTAEPAPLPDELPNSLRQVVLALLEKDPADRTSDLRLVAKVLGGHVDSSNSSLHMVGPPGPARPRGAPLAAGALLAMGLGYGLSTLGDPPSGAESPASTPTPIEATEHPLDRPRFDVVETGVFGDDIDVFTNSAGDKLAWRTSARRAFWAPVSESGALGSATELKLPEGAVETLAGFEPEGQRVLGIGRDREVFRWNLDTGAVEDLGRKLPEASNFRLSPDGRFIACINDYFGLGSTTRLVIVDRESDWEESEYKNDSELGNIAGTAWDEAEDTFLFVSTKWDHRGSESFLGILPVSERDSGVRTLSLGKGPYKGLHWLKDGLELTRRHRGGPELLKTSISEVEQGKPARFVQTLPRDCWHYEGLRDGMRVCVGDNPPRLNGLKVRLLSFDNSWQIAGFDSIDGANDGVGWTHEGPLLASDAPDSERALFTLTAGSRSQIWTTGEELQLTRGFCSLGAEEALLGLRNRPPTTFVRIEADGSIRELTPRSERSLGGSKYREILCGADGKVWFVEGLTGRGKYAVSSVDASSGQLQRVLEFQLDADVYLSTIDYDHRNRQFLVVTRPSPSSLLFIDLDTHEIDRWTPPTELGRLSLQNTTTLGPDESWLFGGIAHSDEQSYGSRTLGEQQYRLWRLDDDRRLTQIWASSFDFIEGLATAPNGREVLVTSDNHNKPVYFFKPSTPVK